MSNGNGHDFSAEIEALHRRQNLQEDREIKHGVRIKDLEYHSANHRDWIVQALGPVQMELQGIRKQLGSMEKAIRKVFALLDKEKR